jgi:hypothetical protein
MSIILHDDPAVEHKPDQQTLAEHRTTLAAAIGARCLVPPALA